MSTETYVKQPSESKSYAIDFVNKLADGDSIASVTSVTGTPTGLTITASAISGTQVTFTVAGGTDGVTYTIEAIVVTTNGETLEGDGWLEVADLPVTTSAPTGWIRNILTFQDCYERAVGFLRAFGHDMPGVATGPPELLRGTIIDAYETVLNSYDWPALQGMGRVHVEAQQTTGTITYTSTGRRLTLSGNTWPSWAEGAAVKIGDYTHQIQTRVSSTVVILNEQLSPADDVAAGTSYKLWRWWYELPRDFGTLESIRRKDGSTPGRMSLATIQDRYHWDYSTSDVSEISIGRNPLKPGRKALYVGAPCSTADVLDFTYALRPRDLRFAGFDSGDTQGTVTVASGDKSVTGSGTAFTDEMEDAILRWATGSTTPTGTHGGNRYAEQQFILSVASATSLTLLQAAAAARSSVAYVVTDPIIIDPSAYPAVLRQIEYQLAMSYRSSHVGSYRNEAQEALKLGIQGSLTDKTPNIVRRWFIGDGTISASDTE